METIKVLMSTYNAGEYLSTQIESILNQEGVSIELYIRDDGSDNYNKNILQEYAKNKNISVEFGGNIGYQNSFLKLLSDHYEDSNKYYSFSDQDDFWDEKKLVTAINQIDGNNDVPALYFSGLSVSDENLNFIRKKDLNDRNLNLGGSISRSNIPGCTMVFNNDLAKKVTEFKGKNELKIGHDAWVQLICAAYDGKFYYGKESYIKYRRLETSLTSTSKSILFIIKDEIKRLEKFPNKAVVISRLIIDNLDGRLSTTNSILLNQILCYKESIRNKMKLIKNHEKDTGNYFIDYYNNILIFLNKY